MGSQRRLENLLEAISHWLNFEKMCNKKGLFNEKYLSYPIGQFLRSRHSTGLRPEYTHPFLNYKGVGAKPKIDFVIKEKINDDWEIIIAIEVKWLSESQSLLKNCIKDILRLALVADNCKKATCFFIISGKYRDWLSKIENNEKFSFTQINGKKINLLGCDVPGHYDLRTNAPNGQFPDVIKKAKKELKPKCVLPDRIRITNYGMYPNYGKDPKKPRRDEYIAIGWEIQT